MAVDAEGGIGGEAGEGGGGAAAGGGEGGVGGGEFGFEGAGFDGPDAAETPGGGDHFLDEGEFDGVGGLEAGEEFKMEALEVGFGFGGEEDGAGLEAVAGGVAGGDGEGFGGAGAAGESAVGSGGVDLADGGHDSQGRHGGGGELGDVVGGIGDFGGNAPPMVAQPERVLLRVPTLPAR